MSFRKEKKFRLSISDFHNIKNLLTSNGMSRLHETRIVNSLYFDTPTLKMFHDSEEGVLPRKKVRIRWYNDRKEFSIEKKISSIEGRYKTVIPSTNSDKSSKFQLMSLFDEIYGDLSPSLLVSYERAYFMFNKIRITFDSKIIYRNKRVLTNSKIEDPERVMEIKTGIDESDDFIESLIPYQTSRFSKYIRGILVTRGEI
tara:strand:+ start:4067 stop:4666 length:600 start_codon:yes stop_codon:yes gene_type:complete